MSHKAPTPRERLLAALAGNPLDRPPCICPGGMMNMVTCDLQKAAGVRLPAAHTDARLMARLARASYQAGCFENYGVPFCMTVEAEALGAQVDLGSETFEPRVTGYAIQSAEQWGQLRSLDCDSGRPRVVLESLRLLAGDEGDGEREELREDGGLGDACRSVPVIGNLVGPVSVAGSVLDAAVLYRQMRRQPQDVQELLEFVTRQLIIFGCAQVAAGADVVAVADPSASGEILGPRLFENFALPCLNRLVDALHACGAPVIVHICGQMHGVYGQLAALRADAISFDAVVPMARARKELPGRVIMGNVSTFAIRGSSPRGVAQAAHRCALCGTDIVAPACGLDMSSPLANVRAVREGALQGQEEEGRKGQAADTEGFDACRA